MKRFSIGIFGALVAAASGCTTVGPDYERPEVPIAPAWYEAERTGSTESGEPPIRWWQTLGDPVLAELVETAFRENNSLKIAGLRVLEARTQLGIATGNRYPQTQLAIGEATANRASENAANTAAGDLDFTQFTLGFSASWEADFWGRFRRGIEAADAAFLGSVAAYDQAMILVAAQVADTYAVLRTTEEQIRITRANIALQERSFEIAEVQFRNGATSELDVLQAQTLLASTQAALPGLEATAARAGHALSTLLGRAPGDLQELATAPDNLPIASIDIPVGVPADLLRRRPDVRRAEYQALAQNARVGLAESNLYPSFTLGGFVGLTAASGTSTTRSGNDGFGELFDGDSLTYSVGPAFFWPFLNYSRIRNSVRIEDARLQQALLAYRDTVLAASREVEDAIAGLRSVREQDALLQQAVAAALRSNELAMLRYQEGFADYQRVLTAQQALFTQQGRYVANRGGIVRSMIALYLALGGGWQNRAERVLVDPESKDTMQQRTDWGGLIEMADDEASRHGPDDSRR